MRKSDKPLVVEKLANQIKGAKSVTVIDYQGISTKAAEELRGKIKEAGGVVVVAKNTLLKLALVKSQLTTHNSQLVPEGLQGPTAVVFAKGDEIAPLQVIGKSIKDTQLPKLKFGLFNGDFIDASKLRALSRLPSRSVLLAQLLGAMNAPKYMFVNTLNGNMQKLVYILGERQKTLSIQQ